MKFRPPSGRAVVFALCAWLACAVGGAGCAHFPPWKRATPPTAPPIHPADTSAEPAPSSTAAAPGAPAAERAPKRRSTEKPIEPAPGNPLPAPAEPAPGDVSAEPVISVDLPPAEKAQLTDTTQRELEQTAILVRTIETRRLSPAEEETLRTIQALVQASREATERREIREAAGLAHKAWILAAEISQR